MAPQTFRTLMTGLVDYAGLFPPSKKPMQEAVENYARYLMGPHAWALGRFVVPVSRFEEFERHASVLMPGTLATSGYREHADILEPWRISALVGEDLESDLDAIDAFNERHEREDAGLARVDAIELRANEPAWIDHALDEIPHDILPFFEIPTDVDCRGFVAAIAGNADSGGACAKIRCGGVTPDAFPSSEQVASFLAACAAADVPFKATAGLHHPVRAERALTYDDDPPRGVMHGFVNLFLAAALLHRRRIDEGGVSEMLAETDPGAFQFCEDEAGWREYRVDAVALARSREALALSYGSCSFDEPVQESRELGWL